MFVKWGIQNYIGDLPFGVKDSLKTGGVRCAEEKVTHTYLRDYDSYGWKSGHQGRSFEGDGSVRLGNFDVN